MPFTIDMHAAFAFKHKATSEPKRSSALEFPIGSNDGQIGKIKAGVIVRAVAYFQIADIEGVCAQRRPWTGKHRYHPATRGTVNDLSFQAD